MAPTPLNQLNPRSKQWSIRVLVWRRWHHRGGSDSGPIKHTDMVLIDKDGNCMYAEISAVHAEDLMDKLKEGRVYDVKNIMVFPNKSFYRSVEGPYMIRMTRFTKTVPVPGAESKFPWCTYALTRLDNLPTPTDMPERFTDVMGLITSISTIGEFYSVHRTEPTVKRFVEIKDLGNTKTKIVLWGETTRKFDEDMVFDLASKGPVIAIFVGMLVKDYEDGRCLSGSAACRWYINEELPDIDTFYEKLDEGPFPIERVVLEGQDAAAGNAQANLETKTVSELLDLNPFENENARFYCTATIRCIAPSQRWWFNACTVCQRTSVPDGAGWKCSVQRCPGIRSRPRYKIPYIVTDGQRDAEFVFFDRIGQELTGKPLMTLLRYDQPPRATPEEIVQFAMANPTIPRDLVAQVGKKFLLVVSISNMVFSYEIKDLSFQVDKIDSDYGDNTSSSALLSKTPFVGISLKQPETLSSSSTAIPPQVSVDGELPIMPVPPIATPPSITKPEKGPKKKLARKSVVKTLFQDGGNGSPPGDDNVNVPIDNSSLKEMSAKDSDAKGLNQDGENDVSSDGDARNPSLDKRAETSNTKEARPPLKKQKK